ncbi:flagellar biosynthesis anti-sigma factor FlgM [Sphingomonas sp. I4]
MPRASRSRPWPCPAAAPPCPAGPSDPRVRPRDIESARRFLSKGFHRPVVSWDVSETDRCGHGGNSNFKAECRGHEDRTGDRRGSWPGDRGSGSRFGVGCDAEGGGDQSALSGLASVMASHPPVNQERIAMIKKAIADGHFPIMPATIADQMIALKLSWNNNDAA